MTVLLGINPEDPAIQDYIQAADDIINSIFSLPINLPGFAYPKVRRLVYTNDAFIFIFEARLNVWNMLH